MAAEQAAGSQAEEAALRCVAGDVAGVGAETQGWPGVVVEVAWACGAVPQASPLEETSGAVHVR